MTAVAPPVSDGLFEASIPEAQVHDNWDRERVIREMMPSTIWGCSLPEAERRAAAYTTGQLFEIRRRHIRGEA